MNCIIVDDEPLAREGLQLMIDGSPELFLTGSFSNARDAAVHLMAHPTDLVLLDIQMPGTNGIEFARNIPAGTLVIFTTAHASYALEGYELDAIDYLVKPLHPERFRKAIDKAISYRALLKREAADHNIEAIAADFIFVRSDRKFFKPHFKEILYIEGLKDYVVIHLPDQRVITAMNIKTIHERLPQSVFFRVSKSYVVNIRHIGSFDNNTVYIRAAEIPIGNSYRAYFFEEVVSKRLVSR